MSHAPIFDQTNYRLVVSWGPISYLWQELRVYNIVDLAAKVANVRHGCAPEKQRNQTVILLFNDWPAASGLKLTHNRVS